LNHPSSAASVAVAGFGRHADEPGRTDERLRAGEHGVFEVAGVGGHDESLPPLLEIRHDVIVERPEAPPPGMSRTRGGGASWSSYGDLNGRARFVPTRDQSIQATPGPMTRQNRARSRQTRGWQRCMPSVPSAATANAQDRRDQDDVRPDTEQQLG